MSHSNVIAPVCIETIEQERSPQEIDRIICDEIDELTQEDNQIWSSPDHDRREYVHSFFQYPAMMVPVVQKRLIEIILSTKPNIKNVFDPYMGSGTSLVACMENGLDCYGQDINPLAVLVAETRTGPFYFKAIAKKKKAFFSSIEKDRSTKIEIRFDSLSKWFKLEVAIELSKIVRAIRKEERKAIRRFYWVILAETIRLTSNDRTSTFKLHARPLEEIEERDQSPIEYFKIHFENCLQDIEQFAELLMESNQLSQGAYVGEVRLSLADSKLNIYTPNAVPNFFDLVVTSPPYGDNKTTVTYGQHSYLPLQWIDLEDIAKNATADFLKTTSEIDSRGLGGKTQWLSEDVLLTLFEASAAFQEIYFLMESLDATRLNKVVSFFYDIYLSIQHIHSRLKTNGYQIWTIGNRTVGGKEITNNQIISEIIEHQGCIHVKTISREILNRRMAARNDSSQLMTFEDIIIFRKIESKKSNED
jgi:DNA modification methylase